MILVVDDEHAIADTLSLILARAGYKSTATYSAAEALAAVANHRPDLIISDVMMPNMNGVDFAVQVCKLYPGVEILLISGHAGTKDLVEAAGSYCGHSLDLLTKPVLPEDMLSRVAEILRRISGV
jgi:DNA-binding response OmpR family regulator